MAWVDVSSINLGGERQGHISLSPPLLIPVLQSVFSHYFISAVTSPFIHPLLAPWLLFSPSHFLVFSSSTPVCLFPLFFLCPLTLLFSPPFFFLGQYCFLFNFPFSSIFPLIWTPFSPPTTSPLPQLSSCVLFLLPQVSDARTISLPLCFSHPHPAPHSRLLLMIKAKTSHQ